MQEKQVKQFREEFNQYRAIQSSQKVEESQYYSQYKKYFASLGEDKFDGTKFSYLFVPQLEKNEIKFCRRSFSSFTVNIINNLSHQEVAEIELQWGYYKLRATIIKNIGENIFHRCRVSHGSLARVYKIDDQRKPFVVKCVSTKTQIFEDKIKMQKWALRQYFIFRIASALGCGPYMKKSFGFDLLFSENCIEFAMEQIMLPDQVYEPKKCQSTKGELVHFDIKPDNLMWSNHFKKEVFVDFGLSEIFNGGPGFKYPVNFKGSLNFCSEQMSQLLINEGRQKSLDIYHNDVNCLKETIKAFQNNFFLFVQESIYDSSFSEWKIKYNKEYLANPLQTKQNIRAKILFKLKIILLKYYILVKSTSNIDQIFQLTAQRDLLFSGEIISFTKNVYSTNEFINFYQRYITNSVKDSVQYGWINTWAKSIYPKTVKVQIQNLQIRSLFQSISQLLAGLSQNHQNILSNSSRVELQTILFRKDIQDQQLYFFCFIRYMSFLNNCHQIDEYQKIKAIHSFIQLFLSQSSSTRQKEAKDSFIKQQIKLLGEIFRYILQYYAHGKYESKKTILDNVNRLDLILDILQHIFFFSLFSVQETVDLLSKIYFLVLWSQQQRMEIIIRVNNDNDWNIISLFSDVTISHIAIQNWVYLRILEFKKQRHKPQIQIVFSIFQSKSNREDLYLLDYEPFLAFSQSLKIQFWLSRLLNELFEKKKFIIVKVMKFIQDNFPHNKKKKLYSIYFHIFSIFNIHYSNRQGSQSICQIFKLNLKSDELFNKLIFNRIIKMQRQNCVKQKIRQLAFIVRLIRYENSGFLMTLLSNTLRKILSLTDQIQSRKYFNQYGVLELVDNLKQVLQRINFKTKLESLIRKCDHQKHLYYYFTLQFSICHLIRQMYHGLNDDINQLQALIQNQLCQRCRLNMYFQFIQLKIQQSIYIRPEDIGQYLIQIYHSYDSFENSIGDREISSQICYVDRVLKTYNSITQKLIHLQYVDSRVLNIFYKLYRFCKHRNIIQRYFQCRTVSTVISYCLKSVCQFGDFEQLTDFLGDIFHYIRYTENVFNIDSICYDFRSFLEGYMIKEKPDLFIQTMNFLDVQEKRQPYVATFYYAFLLSIQNNLDRLTIIIKIFKLIQFMPSKISSFFESSLYSQMFYKDRRLLLLITKKQKVNKKELLSSNSIYIWRREKYFKRMLIKLIHSIQHVTFNRKLSSKKQIKVKQALILKCRNLGSFILPAYSNKKIFIRPVFLL